MSIIDALELDRLLAIEKAAAALQFSAYPAHGSGFVIIVSGGSINDLKDALMSNQALEGSDKPVLDGNEEHDNSSDPSRPDTD